MSAQSLLHNRRVLATGIPQTDHGVGVARGQKARVLRVVQAMNDLFTVLIYSSEDNIWLVNNRCSLNKYWADMHPRTLAYLGCGVDAVLNIPNANRVVPSTTVKSLL